MSKQVLLAQVAGVIVLGLAVVSPTFAAISTEAQAAIDAAVAAPVDVLKEYWVPLGLILGVTLAMKFTKRGAKAL